MHELRNALCRHLGIEVPIFGFSHNVDVTAAIARAGGFPVYGATRDMPDTISRTLARIRDLVGDRPFGVDLLLPANIGAETSRTAVEAKLPAEHRRFVAHLRQKYAVPAATKPTFFSSQVRSQQLFSEQIEAVLGSSANAFATAVGAPQAVIARAKSQGKFTISLVGRPRHARTVKAAGIDLIVAQGSDAGGHTGTIGTFSLVPQIVDIAGDTPVLAAGGVGHGRHLAAALALGAQGVWMGTAWLATREHQLDEIILRKLFAAASEDTVVTRSHSGKPARVLKTSWSDEWDASGAPQPLQMPDHQVLTGELLAAVHEHRIEPLMYEGAGQSVAWFNELTTVEQTIDRLANEAEQALRRARAQ
jgi:NAD(P)H-dependent flavin oxidoreductase YrpB (nitropropane dioxygenase family)